MGDIRPEKQTRVNKDSLIVAVDIGKSTNTGYWRCPDGTDTRPFEFFNNGRGFETLWKRISRARRDHSLKEIVIGFEATGSYGEPLIHYLRKRDARLVQVNPMHTKKVKELQDNSPRKTDQKDPKVIADIMELGRALTLVVPEGAAAELRRLTGARERCMRRRTALVNQIGDLVYIIFPEFLAIMKNVTSASARYLLAQWPTPQEIADYGVETLIGTLGKVSRGRLGKERAEALYEAACRSVGIMEGRESILFEIRNLYAALVSCERFVAELEEVMSVQLAKIPCSKYILSIKGIGEVTVAGLIGEVGDFGKFRTIPEVMKLAGLDLYEISSGAHKGRRRISKRGRSLLRKLLYFATLNTVRCGGIMHEKYRSYLERGMLKQKALIAIARKLLRVIFALVRDRSEYNAACVSMTHSVTEAA